MVGEPVVILLILGAYLLGSVPAAYLVAKWFRGIDIRQYGSGNVGATNILTVGPKWLGVLVILFDFGKGAGIVWVAQLLGMGIVMQVGAGLAVIAGHNWPVFLRFNGGRGILTTLGVATILVLWLFPLALVIAFSFFPFHQLALGVLLAVLSLPVASWFFGQTLGIADKLPVALGFLAMFLIVVARRLTAPRTSVTASVSQGQLLVNRLFFDRDIRDREAWIHRAPLETTEPEILQGQQRGKG
jgi:glycerol-3-phosphate acyltransferase PlsY